MGGIGGRAHHSLEGPQVEIKQRRWGWRSRWVAMAASSARRTEATVPPWQAVAPGPEAAGQRKMAIVLTESRAHETARASLRLCEEQQGARGLCQCHESRAGVQRQRAPRGLDRPLIDPRCWRPRPLTSSGPTGPTPCDDQAATTRQGRARREARGHGLMPLFEAGRARAPTSRGATNQRGGATNRPGSQ